jgi:hypothetical protein
MAKDDENSTPSLVKVMLINAGTTVMYVDLDGKDSTDDIVVLGIRAHETVSITQERVDALKSQYGSSLTVKKIKD